MLITTSADNSLGVWDLALERDPEVRIVYYICVDLSVSSKFLATWAHMLPWAHAARDIAFPFS